MTTGATRETHDSIGASVQSGSRRCCLAGIRRTSNAGVTQIHKNFECFWSRCSTPSKREREKKKSGAEIIRFWSVLLPVQLSDALRSTKCVVLRHDVTRNTQDRSFQFCSSKFQFIPNDDNELTCYFGDQKRPHVRLHAVFLRQLWTESKSLLLDHTINTTTFLRERCPHSSIIWSLDCISKYTLLCKVCLWLSAYDVVG